MGQNFPSVPAYNLFVSNFIEILPDGSASGPL